MLHNVFTIRWFTNFHHMRLTWDTVPTATTIQLDSLLQLGDLGYEVMPLLRCSYCNQNYFLHELCGSTFRSKVLWTCHRWGRAGWVIVSLLENDLLDKVYTCRLHSGTFLSGHLGLLLSGLSPLPKLCFPYKPSLGQYPIYRTYIDSILAFLPFGLATN